MPWCKIKTVLPVPVFRNLAKKKLSFCKISNFIRNQKTNLLPYYECMEEDFLLAGKRSAGEYDLDGDTCATAESAEHHPPFRGRKGIA